MSISLIAQAINILAQFLILLIILSVILSYFLSPLHVARRVVDRIVQPMLNPIRRVIPRLGGFDFSPLILIILVQVLATGIINLLYALR